MKEEESNVSPEQAVQILKAHGVLVTIDQARQILEFMEAFAKLAIDQFVNSVDADSFIDLD